MSKYNSKKVTINNLTFDSKLEADYYLLLSERLQDGEISSFVIQPKYELIPKFEKLGIKYRATTYTPDFLINHIDGTKECIDVKGFGTLASDLRRKLFNYKYQDIKLTWISHCKKYGGWLLYDELAKLRRDNKKLKAE